MGDYGAAILLILVGIFGPDTGEAQATGIVLGAVLLVVSLLTRYPLGAVKLIPFTVHSAGDYLGALALILAPFVLDFYDAEEGASWLYIIVGVVVIALSPVTDYRNDQVGPATTTGRRTASRIG